MFLRTILCLCLIVTLAAAGHVELMGAPTAKQSCQAQLQLLMNSNLWPGNCNGQWATYFQTHIVSSSQHYGSTSIEPSELDRFLSTIPALDHAIKTLFQTMTLIPKIEFQTFSFWANQQSASTTLHVGAARQWQGKIDLFYVTGSAQYNRDPRCGIASWWVPTHAGSRDIIYVDIVDLQRARSWSQCPPLCLTHLAGGGSHIVTGLTLTELNSLKNMLEVQLIKSMQQQTALPSPLHLHLPSRTCSNGWGISISDDDELYNKLASLQAVVAIESKELQTEYEKSGGGPSNTYSHIWANYDSFRASASAIRFTVSKELSAKIIPQVVSGLGLDKQFASAILHYFIPRLELGSQEKSLWMEFVIFLQNSRGHFETVFLLGKKENFEKESFDLILGHSQTDFQMAVDVFVIRDCSSELWGLGKSCDDHFISRPHSVTLEDLEQLTTFSESILLERLVSLTMSSPPVPLGASLWRPEVLLVGPVAGIPLFLSTIDSVSKTWTGVVSAFKTTHSKILERIIPSQGFAALDSTTTIQYDQDIPFNKTTDYLNLMMAQLTSIPAPVQSLYTLFVSKEQIVNHPQTILYDSIATVHANGRLEYFGIAWQPDHTKGTSDFYFSQTSCKWEMSPDLEIWRESKSVFGGIYSDERNVISPRVHDISDADIDMVLKILNMVAFKNLGNALGLPVHYPSE
jgi:hypothetical protein